MNKVKAFTLSEILVVMIISTIVISLTFTVLNMVQKQVKVIKKSIDIKENIQSLERVIWKDFNQFGYGELEGNRLQFKNPIDSVVYSIHNDVIIRDADSIFLVPLSYTFYLDKEVKKQGSVDAIKINFSNPYTSYDLFVFGKKDASFYLNY